jgi:ABC-type phosphate/phosphonate transport system substrate-binding protein
MRRLAAAATLAVLLLAAGCGYSTRSLLRSDLQRVAILPVENSTNQPGIGDEMTDLFAEAFNRDRSLKVTALDAASLVLSAKLTSYTRSAAAYAGDETITLYEVAIGVAVTCEDRARGEEYYSGSLSTRVTYDPDAEVEEAAATRCLTQLADDVVRAIVTKW